MNGTLEDKPVLEVQVENEAKRGLLGVAILNDDLRNNKKTGPSNNQSKPRVFLYFTEKSEDENGQQLLRNKVFSYGIDKIIVLLIRN